MFINAQGNDAQGNFGTGMTRHLLRAAFGIGLIGLASGAAAQDDGVWVQVEAQPTLGDAQDRVRAWAGEFDDVAGYYLESGWYGIVLGPYAEDDARRLLNRLLATGAIPDDSFLAFGDNFEQQFWPIGSGAALDVRPLPDADADGTAASVEAGAGAVPEAVTEAIPEPEPEPEPEPDETVAEARESESALSGAEKELLQTALEWAGFYDGAIDGLYGAGTRAAMEAWQEANGHDATGVLTTRQRAALIGAYNAVLEGLDLQLVRDEATGIEMQIPTGVVSFATYEPPFARFDATGAVDGAQVLLISQSGDQNRLFGLYEILQTLTIIPENGPRERTDDGFTIEGSDGRIVSYTSVSLDGDAIKGFTLVWPAGDEERRTRLLEMMRVSFTSLPGTLDPGIARPTEDQAVDLISGLEVRQPKLSRTGFFIDDQGTVLTTVEAVAACEYVTLDSVHRASVALLDERLGLAVLRPDTALSPIGVAAFQSGVPRLQAEVAVSGYPYGGVLARPALTFGRLADIRGLNGEDEVKRLDLVAQEGDAGGPVFDNTGAVLGMLLPPDTSGAQVLPPEVRFAVDADAIMASLASAGIGVTTVDTMAFMPPETLTREAAEVTVLVSCW
jgi:peptidoglycan hydrolase-like protein with peptidoglycan-binding domain